LLFNKVAVSCIFRRKEEIVKGLVCLLLILSFGSLLYAQLEPKPLAGQEDLLKDKDPKLAANKKIVYDFWREVLEARHLDLAEKYMRPDYMQHNPNAETGIAGFKAYFSRLGGPLPIEPKIKRQVISIVAEGDLVVLNFVQENKDSKGQPYKTTWFDMFRIQDGKIAEHWDSALKP
jgi:predicted SnoaL-like aldol condensation-catalyzing enzyme